MRPGVVANFVSGLQSFSQATLSCLEEQPEGAFSAVSKDGATCWIARGSSLEVIDVATNDRLAAWQFGRVLGDQHTSITCVEELTVGKSLKLLVGVCNSSPTGLLCVFDVALSKVIKAIDVPNPVTELGVVCSSMRDNVPRWALSEHLRYFCGLVAVGTTGGKVYLVDLCLDDTEFYSDEEEASKLHFIWPRNRDIENQRFHCMSQGLHLCMTLNESLFTKNGFEYQKPDGLVMKTLRPETVSITCLKYVPQTGLLIVGYNFGCFQLWRLHIPVLEYSSRLESDPLPVTHIAYQEPENDPKNFCYLWVARGQQVTEESQEFDSVSSVCLYQLAFNSKTFYSHYGIFYEELSSVCMRMDHELTCSPVQYGSNYDGGSRLVACYTLTDPYYRPLVKLGTDESFEEGNHGPDLSLCVFVWEATEGSMSDKVGRHLAIFDINRWYHAQMPSSVRYVAGSTDICSYLCFCKLDDTLDRANTDNLLTVGVAADRLRKFVSNTPMPPEQHFYPASLAFDVKMVFEGGIMRAKFLGSQRQVLANMETKGPVVLVQPHDLYNMCIHVGLLPRTVESSATNPNLVYQRESLLSLALEYNMMCFIKTCITTWASGEHEHQGCSLKVLLDWAWDKVSSTKHTIDTTCVNLYNWSGLILDQRSLHTLYQCNQRLKHLTSLLKTLAAQTGPVTKQGEEELDNKLLVTSLICQHLNVVLWFVGAGLLPEHDDIETVTGGQYCFPATSLVLAYNTRRSELQSIHSEIGETDVLMIDGLVESLGLHELWEREGGSGHYPPPSIHALLSTYLLENVDILSKHCLVLYLLLDLVSVDTTDESFQEKVGRFARTFHLPLTLVKLIQAFWLLDHRDFQEALVLMLDPLVTAEMSRWQHKRIIKALLYQGDARLAQRYISSVGPALTTPDEVKLRLTVLLANGLTAEALEYQRQCRDDHNMQDLLSHLILGCQQTKTVDRLLQLPLNVDEERVLIEYLMDSTEPQLQELLVMHYLQRARFVEAIQLNEKLKHSVLTETNAKARERAASRNAVVDKYATILPSVQRKLLYEQIHVPKKNIQWRREVRRPTPLSTKITKSKGTVMSQSTFIMTIMEKLDEIETADKTSNDERTKSVGPFICTPVKPARKSLRDTPITAYPESKDGKKSGGLSLNKSLGLFQDVDSPFRGETRHSQFFSASCLTLLQTPTVQKMTPRKHRLSSANVITPQSILKVKHMILTTSPSPHSGNVTPNSTEIESSVKKVPRKLGYGAALSQPGTPRSVSFSDPPLSSLPRHLAGDMQTSSQPASQPASPKSVSFAEPSSSQDTDNNRPSRPTTPKSVSFASMGSKMRTASAMQPLSTPKQLRFTQGASPIVSGSRWTGTASPPSSPDSPRSVKDRSPTPESSQFSPHLAGQVDVLPRRPLRTTPTKEELNLQLEVSEDEDNISDEDVEDMDGSYSTMAASPASTGTVCSPGHMTTSPRQPSPQTTPESSPVKPASPTVKISKSPISIYSSESLLKSEIAQSPSSSTEHAQQEVDESIKRNVPVNIDLTEDEEMEVEEQQNLSSDQEIVAMETAKNESEIFSAEEELSDEVEDDIMGDSGLVSSSGITQQEVMSVTQTIKQEVEKFSMPPEPVRELQPPSPPKTESDTSSDTSPLRRRSMTPPQQRNIQLIKPKDSPPDTGYSTTVVTESTSVVVVTKSSPKFIDNIMDEIDSKFAESPELPVEDVKASLRTASVAELTVETSKTRTRQTFDITLKLDTDVKDVVSQEPTTPTRSSRRKATKDGLAEVTTPTRSSRRLQREQEGDISTVTDATAESPARSVVKNKPKDEVIDSNVVVSANTEEIIVKSPRQFSQSAKEAVNESLKTLSSEMRAHSQTVSPDRSIMTRIKAHNQSPERTLSEAEEMEKMSPVKTPTRTRRRQSEAATPTRATPTRASARKSGKTVNVEENINNENVKTTPSRSRRGKKTEEIVEESIEQITTPSRRGRKSSSPEKLSKSPGRNKNTNNSSSPTKSSLSPLIENSEIPSVAQTVVTPKRGRKKKEKDSVVTPLLTDNTQVLNENSQNIELTPSRRGSFGMSEIPEDFEDENLEGTPSRRRSLGRNCKTIAPLPPQSGTPTRRRTLAGAEIPQQLRTPTRRRSLGRSVKLSETETDVISSPAKSEIATEPVTPTRTPGRKGRGKKTQDTPVKPIAVEDIKQVITPSRRGKSSKIETDNIENVIEDNKQNITVKKEETDSANVGNAASVVEQAVTPSRRGRPKKAKLETEVGDGNSAEREPSPKLTPSRSKRAKQDKKKEVTEDKVETETNKSITAGFPDVYDIQSSSFQFSVPMEVDGAIEPDVPAKAFTPIKSFIFSPPISQRRHSESRVERETEGILLPPGPAVTQVTTDKVPEKKARAVKATRTRTRKLYSEQEEIMLISPGMSQAANDSAGEEGMHIITRTTRAATKKVQTKKDGTKLLVQSMTGRGRGQRTSHRIGPLGQRK